MSSTLPLIGRGVCGVAAAFHGRYFHYVETQGGAFYFEKKKWVRALMPPSSPREHCVRNFCVFVMRHTLELHSEQRAKCSSLRSTLMSEAGRMSAKVVYCPQPRLPQHQDHSHPNTGHSSRLTKLIIVCKEVKDRLAKRQ